LVNEYKIGMFEQLKMESRLKGYRLASGSHWQEKSRLLIAFRYPCANLIRIP
jgi:hypothetical protein